MPWRKLAKLPEPHQSAIRQRLELLRPNCAELYPTGVAVYLDAADRPVFTKGSYSPRDASRVDWAAEAAREDGIEAVKRQRVECQELDRSFSAQWLVLDDKCDALQHELENIPVELAKLKAEKAELRRKQRLLRSPRWSMWLQEFTRENPNALD